MIAGAAAAGALGWSGVTLALPLALAFPALWAIAPSRRIAIAVSAAYFLAASRGLPPGVSTFYGSELLWGGALWVVAWFGKGDSARAHLFDNPVVQLRGHRIAPLICYEQLLVWPVLHSMLHAPEAIVATGNGWWTARTSIVGIQRASVEAWARLFGVPLVTAFNL